MCIAGGFRRSTASAHWHSPAAHAITLQRDSRSCSRCSQQTWRLKSERPLRCRPGHLRAKDHDRRDPQSDLPAQIVLVPLRGLRAAARDICPDIRNLLAQLPAHQRVVGLILGLHGLHAFLQHGELPREILCCRRRANELRMGNDFLPVKKNCPCFGGGRLKLPKRRLAHNCQSRLQASVSASVPSPNPSFFGPAIKMGLWNSEIERLRTCW